MELRGLIDTTRGQMEEAKRAAAQLEVEIAREETQLQAQAQERDEASRRRDLALEQFGADWSNRLQKARADLSKISSDELAVREKIQALTEGQTGQLRDAEGRLEQAQRRQEQAEEKLVLLLDDQLAQTDDVRMKWFRQKLQESSKKIQIVVFTCRPEDYLDENTKVGNESGPGQDQRARAVDLTKALERAG